MLKHCTDPTCSLTESAQGQDEELAQLEEETARKLQDRMAAELEHMVAEDLLPQVSATSQGQPDPSELVCNFLSKFLSLLHI